MAPRFCRALLRLLPLPGRVLEAGSGTAAASRWLSRRGAQFVALDLTALPLRSIRGVPRCQRVQGDLLRLPFPARSFDLAWSVSTLEHFPDPLPILREMMRVGRSVAAAVPGSEGAWTPLLGAMERAGYQGTGEWYRLYSKEEIRRVFLEAGVRNPRVQTIHFLGMFPFHLVAGETTT